MRCVKAEDNEIRFIVFVTSNNITLSDLTYDRTNVIPKHHILNPQNSFSRSVGGLNRNFPCSTGEQSEDLWISEKKL